MLKKILHSALAILIVISATGVTVNMHYCHDHLYDLAVFAPAHSCCDPGSHRHCHAMEGISNMDHCADASINMEATDDYMGSFPAFELENTHTLDLLQAVNTVLNFQGEDQYHTLKTPWYQEPPPFQEVELSQIQSFLI